MQIRHVNRSSAPFNPAGKGIFRPVQPIATEINRVQQTDQPIYYYQMRIVLILRPAMWQ